MIPVGIEAPDFTIPDQDGNPVTLSSFRGSQPVVLIFYPGDQTPICTMQMCDFRDNYEALTHAGIVVLGINADSAESHKDFINRNNFQFRLLVDKKKEVLEQYDSLLLKFGPFTIVKRTVYAIGKDGNIIFAEPGTPSVQTVLAAIQQYEQQNTQNPT